MKRSLSAHHIGHFFYHGNIRIFQISLLHNRTFHYLRLCVCTKCTVRCFFQLIVIFKIYNLQSSIDIRPILTENISLLIDTNIICTYPDRTILSLYSSDSLSIRYPSLSTLNAPFLVYTVPFPLCTAKKPLPFRPKSSVRPVSRSAFGV